MRLAVLTFDEPRDLLLIAIAIATVLQQHLTAWLLSLILSIHSMRIRGVLVNQLRLLVYEQMLSF